MENLQGVYENNESIRELKYKMIDELSDVLRKYDEIHPADRIKILATFYANLGHWHDSILRNVNGGRKSKKHRRYKNKQYRKTKNKQHKYKNKKHRQGKYKKVKKEENVQQINIKNKSMCFFILFYYLIIFFIISK